MTDRADTPQDGWLLMKRGLYWRPGGHGYTGVKSQAGRWSRAKAVEICRNGDSTRIHESEAKPYAPSCCHDIRSRDMERIRLAEKARQELADHIAEWILEQAI
jgi:hypothetical protein